MKSTAVFLSTMMAMAIFPTLCRAEKRPPARELKVHSIFSSNMVLQRDKPVAIWGWGRADSKVKVSLGEKQAESGADANGRWKVTFPAMEASADPRKLIVTSGGKTIGMTNIVVGDVWVMNGQSNMAIGLNKMQHADMEAAQANLPLLRLFSIAPNEQSELAEDIPTDKITSEGWVVSSPETARDFAAIGYVFGARLQRVLQTPIGIIKNARGGASLESLVPRHKFADDPIAKRYAESVEKRIAAFDPEAEANVIWKRQLGRAKAKKVPEEKWPKRPDPKKLRSWNVPGKSPSDMASCYNGMFGVFKGYNIKGVLFHQGYNNAISGNCRPNRYRILMKLMVEGWREDFNDPTLPVGVIGFCAGGNTQNEDNFEEHSYAGGPYIREAQRLGLADVGDPKNTAFIPAYDVQVPGLHPSKKREHGLRAARWALSRIYGMKGMHWYTTKLVSTEPQGDMMVLTFEGRVPPDDKNSILRGFSIAGEDGKLYMAHARFRQIDGPWWEGSKIIHVWSPLVKKPVAVRYGWATSPMGNLKVNGHQDCSFPSFRTDSWDWPESDDPEVSLVGRGESKAMKREAVERLDYRRTQEAKGAVEILERIKMLAEPSKEEKNLTKKLNTNQLGKTH